MWTNRGIWPRVSLWSRIRGSIFSKPWLCVAAICAVVALGPASLSGCAQSVAEPPPQPLCGVALPEQGAWRWVWRSHLPEAGIWAVARDGDRLWLATPDDLVRLDLDTLECTRFAHTEDEPALPLSDVRALAPDPEGRLWAAGDHGLARFDGVRWRAVLTDVHAHGLAFDAAGNLWVGTTSASGGIAWLRYPGHEPPEGGRWEAEEHRASPPEEGVCDRWSAMAGATSCLPRFHSPQECRLLTAWQQRLASAPPPEGVAPWGEHPPIAAESQDHVWLLAERLPDQPEPHQVLLGFDGQTWQVLPWPYGRTSLLAADEGRGGVWVGTEEGLVFSDGQAAQRYLLTPGDAVPLGPEATLDLATDADGRLWAATSDGLLLYNERTDSWQPTGVDWPALISADDRGGLWAVPRFTPEGDFGYFDGEEWTFYEFPPDWPCTPRSILADVGGGLWLSSFSCALRGFNGEVWDEYDSGPGGGLLARGPGREVYAAEIAGEVRRWDGERWEVLPSPAASPSLEVTDLAVGPNGTVWIAYGQPPSLRRYQDGVWSDVPLETGVTALLVGSDATLWAAAEGMLLHYDGDAWERIESPFPLGRADALAEDRQGRIWVGGQTGLAVYNPQGE